MARLQTIDTAVPRRKPNTPPAIGTKRNGDEPRGNSVCAPARAPASVVPAVVGVSRGTPVRVVVCGVEADFVHVGFTDDEGARIDEFLDAPGGFASVRGGGVTAGRFGEGEAESFGGAGDSELVFDEDRDAVERGARGGAGVGGCGGCGGGGHGEDSAYCVWGGG